LVPQPLTRVTARAIERAGISRRIDVTLTGERYRYCPSVAAETRPAGGSDRR
jgi:hypothetical protein